MKIRTKCKQKVFITLSEKEANKLLDHINEIAEFMDECPTEINGVEKPTKRMSKLNNFAEELERVTNNLLW